MQAELTFTGFLILIFGSRGSFYCCSLQKMFSSLFSCGVNSSRNYLHPAHMSYVSENLSDLLQHGEGNFLLFSCTFFAEHYFCFQISTFHHFSFKLTSVLGPLNIWLCFQPNPTFEKNC